MKQLLKTFALGILAGLILSLAGFAFTFIKGNSSDTLANIGASLIFTFGLFVICSLGLNLFTGKIAFVIDNKKSFWIDLLLIYLGNFIGCLVMGYIGYAITKNNEVLQGFLTKLVETKTLNAFNFNGFINIFLKAFLCGICVFLSVFMFNKFQNHLFKFFGVILPVFIFCICGFEHCIANMFYFSMANAWAQGGVWLNILYVTLGNSVSAILVYLLFKVCKLESRV